MCLNKRDLSPDADQSRSLAKSCEVLRVDLLLRSVCILNLTVLHFNLWGLKTHVFLFFRLRKKTFYKYDLEL